VPGNSLNRERAQSLDSSGLLNRTRCAAMQVFLYEFICGGGLFAEDEPPAGSLYREGWAMLSALAEDFAALPGVELTILWDERIGASPPASCRVVRIRSAADEEEQLERLAAASDCTLLIAPESGGALLSRASRAAATESQLVSPAPEFIELASDKQRTAEMLRSRGVPAPPGVLLNQARRLPSEFPLPAVLKPNDGAGSQAIRWIEDESQLGCIIGGENLETAREHGRPQSRRKLFSPRNVSSRGSRQHRRAVRTAGFHSAATLPATAEQRRPFCLPRRRTLLAAATGIAGAQACRPDARSASPCARLRRARPGSWSGKRRQRGCRHRSEPAADDFVCRAASRRGAELSRRDARCRSRAGTSIELRQATATIRGGRKRVPFSLDRSLVARLSESPPSRLEESSPRDLP